MREIKFRVWFKAINAMYDPQLLTSAAVNETRQDMPGLYLPFDKDTVLMQYTGLKDKNGKEIYEGDIVRYVEKTDDHGDRQKLIAEVFYDNESAAFAIGRNNDVWNMFTDTGLYDIEAIGNVFEHKNLLEQQTKIAESWSDSPIHDEIRAAGLYDAQLPAEADHK